MDIALFQEIELPTLEAASQVAEATLAISTAVEATDRKESPQLQAMDDTEEIKLTWDGVLVQAARELWKHWNRAAGGTHHIDIKGQELDTSGCANPTL